MSDEQWKNEERGGPISPVSRVNVLVRVSVTVKRSVNVNVGVGVSMKRGRPASSVLIFFLFSPVFPLTHDK
jgi:hypothetical protein